LDKPLTVLIADDHRLICEGIKLVLEKDNIKVVGRAASGRQAIEKVKELNPSVVLLDIRMPDMDGLQALGAIKANSPDVSVIMLTSYSIPEYITRAISLGAAGYLLKDTDPDSVRYAVRAVASGEAIVDRDILIQVSEHLSAVTNHKDAGFDIPSLTPQEIRILQLIAEGLDNNTIAEILSVSPNTVKSHASNIFSKLGVSDRTQAAIWAIRNGLAA
jgi:DNA-binding NarL/FixJ family response regulator